MVTNTAFFLSPAEQKATLTKEQAMTFNQLVRHFGVAVLIAAMITVGYACYIDIVT